MPEYNPVNEKLKKQYEEALLHGKHQQKKTVDAVWKAITQFETFTGRQSFSTFNKEQAKGFKVWLEKQTNPKGEPLSLASLRSTLAAVREFFIWLAIHPQMRRHIDPRAAEYLHLSKNEDRAARASKPRSIPTLEQMRQAIMGMPHETDVEKRDRAIMAFLAMTAMRDAALISLRLEDVNLEKMTVWQDPKHVKTKFRKGIYTALIPLEPLFSNIVVEWVRYLREDLKRSPKSPLFPSTEVKANPETLAFEVTGLSETPWASAAAVRDIFKTAFERVGLPYFHPHTCRHMIIAWGMERLNLQEMKALSQNLGHDNMMTTYNSYGYIQPEKQVSLLHDIGYRGEKLATLTTEELMEEYMRRKAT
ncbi:MAG: recombinase XerC [Alphaproteobacteria bacterium CG_4_10_14_0_8_um_filter_53_9]|nr:MAG: recombinase XerC [Alphaproteobacteria bacterium CG_4_10_14_0_8_um_filter_53_9]